MEVEIESEVESWRIKDPLGLAPFSKDLEERKDRPAPDKVYTGSIEHDIIYQKR